MLLILGEGRVDGTAGDRRFEELMYEIKVTDLATNSPDFGVVKRTVLERYDRLYKHVPDGRLSYKRAASQREIVSGTYMQLVVSHGFIAANAFRSDVYAPGFALMRPMLEALLKQFVVGNYGGVDDGWKHDIAAQPRINTGSLKRLAELGGPDFTPLWTNLSHWLNDFVHGGYGQLSSNYNPTTGEPCYPASWFWHAMIITTLSMLTSSAWFLTYLGHEDRAKAVLRGMQVESWDTLTVTHNGQEVKIIAEDSPVVTTL